MSNAALEDLVNVHSVIRNLLTIYAACSGDIVRRTIYTGILNLYEGVSTLKESSEMLPQEDCDKFRGKIWEYVLKPSPGVVPIDLP